MSCEGSGTTHGNKAFWKVPRLVTRTGPGYCKRLYSSVVIS